MAAYTPAMPDTKRTSAAETRMHWFEALREVEAGQHRLVDIRHRTVAVVVPLDWYRRAREATGEPTDL